MSLEESVEELRELLLETSSSDACSKARETWIKVLDALLCEIKTLRAKIEGESKKLEKLTSLCVKICSDFDNLKEAFEDLCEYYEDDFNIKEALIDHYESAICSECEHEFMFNPDLLGKEEFLICPNCGRLVDQKKSNMEG